MEDTLHRLKAAAKAGDIDVLYCSLNENPNILNQIDEIPFVDTPLHTAASAGCTHFAIEIISLKPSFGRKLNTNGLSPLHLALQNQRFETVKKLIKVDKELIRVKGRERHTPLHYVAETDEIDLLAEFLCACPASIEDVTVRDETAVHLAVKNFRLRAFKVLFGWLRRTRRARVLNMRDEEGNTVLHTAVSTTQPQVVELLVKADHVKINEMNSERLTALDIAVELGQDEARKKIVNILSRARASKSSSFPGACSLADFLMSPDPFLEVISIFISSRRRILSMEMCGIVLVVAVLIATATFQAVLSPPGESGGGGGSDNNQLPTNSTGIKATISTINSPTNNISQGGATTVTPAIPATNPFERVPCVRPLYGGEFKSKDEFFAYYFLNSLSFVASILVIIVVMDIRLFSGLLHGSLVFLTMNYGISFSAIAPSYWYVTAIRDASSGVAMSAYAMKVLFYIIENMHMTNRKPLWMSRLQAQRLQMLHGLVLN